MAMRIRTINGKVVAVCAAQHAPEHEDHYIDDEEDHAIREKIARDWSSEGIGLCRVKTVTWKAMVLMLAVLYAAVTLSLVGLWLILKL